MQQSDYAPIVIFGYNRPEHIKRCLLSLKQNVEANQSLLYVYIDAVKDKTDVLNTQRNNEVLKIVESEQWCGKVKIVQRETNYGVEKNIIHALNEIFIVHDRVIVLEDDLVVSDSFLRFMNRGLNIYQDDRRILQICGCNLMDTVNYKYDALFLPIASSWGWATWKRVWMGIHFETDNVLLAHSQRYLFDIEGAFPYYHMLSSQHQKGKGNTWDILFWLHVFRSKGVVLYPKKNLVSNMGFDGSGTHYTNELNTGTFKVYNNVAFDKFPPSGLWQDNHLSELKRTLLRLNQPNIGIIKNVLVYLMRRLWNIHTSLRKYYEY